MAGPYRFGWFDWFCLWYPPGWLILFNRHWQHYKPDPDGWNWLEYVLFLVPGGFYLALALRWTRTWVRSRLSGRSAAAAPEPDPAYQQSFQAEILTPILTHYFRTTLHQIENIPATGPLIIAMNHAGMCLPWDFVGLGLVISEQRPWFVQPLAHSLFFDHPWLVWWLPQGWAHVLGGVRAERDSFEETIHNDKTAIDRVLLYAPESWRGLTKGWHQRYQLATFDPSFLRLSLRHQVPVLPVVCMGSEYLHPFTVNVPWLARRLGMPLFPLSPLVLAFVLFPSMGVWAMRTHLQYYVQPIEAPWEHPKLTAPDTPTRTIYRMAETLRSRLQIVIDQLRGKPIRDKG